MYCGQMNGVAVDVEVDMVLEVETDESGPVYADDESVDVVAPMPILIVFVLEEGITDERLVEYVELGCAPIGI